jgi:hypothetical protein
LALGDGRTVFSHPITVKCPNGVNGDTSEACDRGDINQSGEGSVGKAADGSVGEMERLRSENTIQQQDLETIANRILKNLNLGTQAPRYKVARKVLA